MAGEDGGKHLWIRAEGNGDPWGEWGVDRYPTVKIVHLGDPFGYAVENRENPLNEIPSALEDDTARTKRLVDNILSRMENGLVSETKKAAEELARLMNEGKIDFEDYSELFINNPGARVGLILALGMASDGFMSSEVKSEFLIGVAQKDPDEWVRRTAVLNLPGELWSMTTRAPIGSVVPERKALLALLFADSSIHVRDAAAEKLTSHILSIEEKKILIENFGSRIGSGYWGPINAMELLMRFYDVNPSRVDDLLFNFLVHSDWLVRREATGVMEMFSQHFNPQTSDRTKFISQLRKMVDVDPIEEVRLSAATALVGALGDKYPPAVPLFVEGMKNWGSRTYLRMETNPEEFTKDEIVSFLSKASLFKVSVLLGNLQSMGELAKEAVPDLIEEVRIFPSDTGKMENILQAILAIDPSGFSGHLQKIWFQSTSHLVDQLVLDQASLLGEKGIELLEGFLKEESMNIKGVYHANSFGLQFRGTYFRKKIESILSKMRTSDQNTP